MIERFAQMYASWMFPAIIFALATWSAWEALRDSRRGAK